MCIKISVILPSYNVADYIEQCVRSVMEQTLYEIEILCIDAGSTDGTLEKIEELAAIDSRIRVFRSEKKSYGYQMNLGIREAQGKYIGIVETDDYVDPDMYEVLYRRAEECGADMVKGVLYDVYETQDGDTKEIYVDYINERFMTDAIIEPDKEPDVHNWDGNIWNGIYRRDFLTDKMISFQETPGAAFQDIAFQQMVLNEAQKVAYMHAHFYHYRKIRPGASTWNPKCVRYISDAYRGLLSDERLKEGHKKFIYARLASAFLFELKKSLCMSGYELDRMEYPEAVEWYEKEIKQAINRGYFRFDDLPESPREEVIRYFADRELFIDFWRERSEPVYTWMEELKRRIGNSRLVIFGMGQYGHMLLLFLIRNGMRVEAIADNQKANNNTSIFGMRVYSAADVTRNKDSFYLVANKKAGIQISVQLQKLGVSEDKIWIFDGTDDALVKGIKSAYILPQRTGADLR